LGGLGGKENARFKIVGIKGVRLDCKMEMVMTYIRLMFQYLTMRYALCQLLP